LLSQENQFVIHMKGGQIMRKRRFSIIFFFRIISVFIVCTMLLLVTGCAFGTRRVTLVYPPEKAEISDAKVAEAAASPTINGKSVVLQQFADQRSNKECIGEVRNGLGMRTADVVAENSVTEWVTQAVKEEMEKAGYKVTKVDSITMPTTDIVVLTGDIITVYCIALFSYEGEVSFFAILQKDGKEILNKRYTGKGSAGLNWAASSSSYGYSLSVALASAASNLVDDIKTVLK
jgi:hypothetical protein